MSSVTPFFAIAVSSSLTISSKVKPYWKPEQPPPCTNTRSFRSGLPSSSTSSLTLLAALSVKTSGGGGASSSGELTMFSATARRQRSGERQKRRLSAKRRNDGRGGDKRNMRPVIETTRPPAGGLSNEQ